MRKLSKLVLWVVLLAGAVVGIARGVAIRWYQVPINDPYLDASITPTLRGGDWILLWRLTAPGYGDLVMCPEPKFPERIVIGRLIGEGDDTIEIKRRGISVNGRNVSIERVCSQPKFTVLDPNDGSEVEQFCHLERVGSVLHLRGAPTKERLGLQEVRQKVNPGTVFLVSDNRQFPYDSRDYGTVDRQTCKESVVFRVVGKEGWFDVDSRLTVIR